MHFNGWIAHRGGRAYGPDNSLQAAQGCLEACRAAGVPLVGIELDCQRTRDDRIVFHHSEKLAGARIDQMLGTQAEAAGLWSLRQLVEGELADAWDFVVLDIKPLTSFRRASACIRAVAAEIERHDLKGRAIVQVRFARNAKTALALFAPEQVWQLHGLPMPMRHPLSGRLRLRARTGRGSHLRVLEAASIFGQGDHQAQSLAVGCITRPELVQHVGLSRARFAYADDPVMMHGHL